MKNSTKFLALALFAIMGLFTTKAHAQSGTPNNAWRFGIGVEGGLPTGNLHNISNIGLGGTARLQYGINKNVALMITSGYYNFFGKDVSSTNPMLYGPVKDGHYYSFGMVPLKGGIKAYVGSGFYVSGEVGAGFVTRNAYDEDGDKNTKLILAPGLGYSWTNVDLGVRYENYSGQDNNYGMVALRLAYGFKL